MVIETGTAIVVGLAVVGGAAVVAAGVMGMKRLLGGKGSGEKRPPDVPAMRKRLADLQRQRAEELRKEERLLADQRAYEQALRSAEQAFAAGKAKPADEATLEDLQEKVNRRTMACKSFKRIVNSNRNVIRLLDDATSTLQEGIAIALTLDSVPEAMIAEARETVSTKLQIVDNKVAEVEMAAEMRDQAWQETDERYKLRSASGSESVLEGLGEKSVVPTDAGKESASAGEAGGPEKDTDTGTGGR